MSWNYLTTARGLCSSANGRLCRYVLAMGVVASICVTPPASIGQRQTPPTREYIIKAAYIYNFMRYIEWPSNAFADAESPFVVGILGQVPPDLDRSLAIYEKRKKVRGRAIQIRRFKSAEEITDCHVVFLTKSRDSKLLKEAVERFSGNPTLLVGETSDFLEQGGGITFVIASNKVRFRLALKEIQRKGLKPSAKLLQVALAAD